MLTEISALLLTAAGIAFVHTMMGPDHYLPFIGMARAGQWSKWKTVRVTIICGLLHVASSVLVGFVGIALGLSLSTLTSLETTRGSIAAWSLIAFGLTYFVWGLIAARRNRPHQHWHLHGDAPPHYHGHSHREEHLHVHKQARQGAFSSWALFAIFLFGPCEPLIPLLMYPAATSSGWAVALVAGIFAVVTIATMLGAVMLGCAGATSIGFGFGSGKRYAHAFAGSMIFLCGMLIQFAGL